MMKDKKLDELRKTAEDVCSNAKAQTAELDDDALDGVAGGMATVTLPDGTPELKIK